MLASRKARGRAGEQHAHAAHFPVVDHRQRALHAVEQQDHAGQPGHDVHLIGDVGVVGRDDGDAQCRAKAGGEHQQPQQGPYQGAEQPGALQHETQPFARYDAAETLPVSIHGRTPEAVKRVKAEPRVPPCSRLTASACPLATRRPWCTINRSSLGCTSSSR